MAWSDYFDGDPFDSEGYYTGSRGYGSEYRFGPPPTKTCRLCGTSGLYWHNIGGQWKLSVHECNKSLTVSRPEEFPFLTSEV